MIKKQFNNIKIWVRGAGELGSATAHLLHSVGFSVFLSELSRPLAIRRTVTFSDTMYGCKTNVEGVKGKLCNISDIYDFFSKGVIPVLFDDSKIINTIKPDIYIDARMLKCDQRDIRQNTLFSIGLGPGFTAKINCDVVIETMRGHDLGRVILNGSALPNTNVPGKIKGESKRRIIRASESGNIIWNVNFGQIVNKNDLLGKIGSTKVQAPFRGIVRGLISSKIEVIEKMKIGDLDPRCESVDIYRLSDKSRSIARGVLEAILTTDIF